MGFLSSVFGGEKELPRLDDQSVTARRIEQNRAPLETFAAKVKDRLELVPTSDVTYFFIGKPPGTFGIASAIHAVDRSNCVNDIASGKLTRRGYNRLPRR